MLSDLNSWRFFIKGSLGKGLGDFQKKFYLLALLVNLAQGVAFDFTQGITQGIFWLEISFNLRVVKLKRTSLS